MGLWDNATEHVTNVIKKVNKVTGIQAVADKLVEPDIMDANSDLMSFQAKALPKFSAQYDRMYPNKSVEDNTIKIDNPIPIRNAALTAVNTVTKERKPRPTSVPLTTINRDGWAQNNKVYEKKISDVMAGNGWFDNLDEVQAKIIQLNPNSPINAQNISNLSNKYSLPWEEIMATIQQEGVLQNKEALKDNNFGGLTWSKRYQDAHPEVSKGRPRPEGGYYVHFPTPESGLERMVKLLAAYPKK